MCRPRSLRSPGMLFALPSLLKRCFCMVLKRLQGPPYHGQRGWGGAGNSASQDERAAEQWSGRAPRGRTPGVCGPAPLSCRCRRRRLPARRGGAAPRGARCAAWTGCRCARPCPAGRPRRRHPCCWTARRRSCLQRGGRQSQVCGMPGSARGAAVAAGRRLEAGRPARRRSTRRRRWPSSHHPGTCNRA